MNYKVQLLHGKGEVNAELIEKENGCSLLKLLATNAVVTPDGEACYFDGESWARNYYNKVKNETD